MAAREPENGDGGADPENLFGGGTGIEIRKTPAAVRLRAFCLKLKSGNKKRQEVNTG